MKESCKKHRCMNLLKKTFVHCTNSHCWQDAMGRFTSFADDSRLAWLMLLNVKNGVPEVFCDCCKAALNTRGKIDVDCYTIADKETKGYIVHGDAKSSKNAVGCFHGISLLVAHIFCGVNYACII